MSALGMGYDLSATTFSTDGRIFQVEYASKAVENTGLVVALRLKDSIAFAVEKPMISGLLVPTGGRRIFTITNTIGMAVAGLLPDARQLVSRARDEAENYKSQYGIEIPVSVLGDRLALNMQTYTMYAAARPFGCSVLLGGVGSGTPELYLIEPSGLKRGCLGMAVGKGKMKQEARNMIEKLTNLDELELKDGVVESAKIILALHDDSEDKKMHLEVSGLAADFPHQIFDNEQTEEIERLAKQSIEESE